MKCSAVIVNLVALALASVAVFADAACLPTSEELGQLASEQAKLLIEVGNGSVVMQQSADKETWLKSAEGVLKILTKAAEPHKRLGITPQYCAVSEKLFADIAAQVDYLARDNTPLGHIAAANHLIEVAKEFGVTKGNLK